MGIWFRFVISIHFSAIYRQTLNVTLCRVMKIFHQIVSFATFQVTTELTSPLISIAYFWLLLEVL